MDHSLNEHPGNEWRGTGMGTDSKQSGFEFTHKQREEINELKGVVECSYDFECCRLASDTLRKVNIVGRDQFIECDECLTDEVKKDCIFKMSFGMGYLRRCPLRKYIAVSVGM